LEKAVAMVELRAPGGIAEHRIDNLTLILPGIVIVLLIGWFLKQFFVYFVNFLRLFKSILKALLFTSWSTT